MSFSFAIHIIFLNIIYVLELVLIDASNGFKVYSSPSNNLHVTIGGTVGAFVIVVIGVVIAIIVKRLKRKSREMVKRQSFALETRQLDMTKPKIKQPNLPSKI